VRPTTIVRSDLIDDLARTKIVIASETFQRTGSFKFRAAFNVANNVAHNKLIAASSGNFGQALAYSCKLLQKSCIIVMPSTSAVVKIDAVKRYGGRVELVDTASKRRADRVSELAAENDDAVVVSAFDDDFVIEGNSTLGEELADIESQFDCLVVPVGGGGLIAGILNGLRRKGCQKPVYGAEPVLANDAARSLQAGKLISNDEEPQTIADGVRTLALGERNWQIIREGVEGIVEVPEEKIGEAFRALFLSANLKVEPTGALALAAVLSDPDRFAGKTVCCIATGGNVDPSTLQKLLDS